ncbi:MAG: GDSL-type esterase/lipase family protein [Actinomycetota bacterium]|nr:GDSL-type esterase/lipase family protein [Actinomycetota bacterium]
MTPQYFETHCAGRRIPLQWVRRPALGERGNRWHARRLGASLRILAALTFTMGWAATAFTPASATTTTATAPAWQTTWTSPTDLGVGVTANSTTRDIATVAVAGTSLEFTFSNLWSATPTTFSAVTVGVQRTGVVVAPGTFIPVTFNASRSVIIAPHARVTSDPIAMTVHAGESLAISIAVSGSATVSVHYCCYGRIDSYATSNGAGDLTASPSGAGFDPILTTPNMRWLSAISVGGSSAQGTVVALGDSITDGFGYTNNGFSWVNALQRRISQLPASQQMSVVNEGIAGNTLLAFPPGTTYEVDSGGLPGVTRLSPDALALPGVKDVVLFLGINDIWFGAGGVTGHPIPPYGTASALIAGMRQAINESHAHGIKVFGITLLPRSTSTGVDNEKPEIWSPSEQAIWSALKAWMLSSRSGFDGVINLAAMMGDVYNGACQPTLPYPPYFNSDNLHPNVVGQTVMADAVSTTIFGMPEAPQSPLLLNPTPTPGCAAAKLAEKTLALGSQSSPPTTSMTSVTRPVVSTIRPTPAPRGWTSHPTTYFAIALLASVVAALWSVRQRVHRRRALRRRMARPADVPRTSPPRLPRSGSSTPRR